MPYRDRATVASWVDEFLQGRAVGPEISVLDQEYTAGPNSGLVVVSLRTASTITYIQPVVQDDVPRWVVTFEARSHSFDLDATGVSKLANDLELLAALCRHLQQRTDEARAARGPAPAVATAD